MKNAFIFPLFLMLINCNGISYYKEKLDTGTDKGNLIEQTTYDPKSDLLIRYYQNGLAIHHMKSGEFAFCQVCFSNLEQLPEDELVNNATVTVDWKMGKIEVYDSHGILVKTYLKDTEIDGNLIYGVGYAFGYFPSGNVDFSYLQSQNGGNEPPVMQLSCQCVPLTSTPCGPNGSDLGGCDVGGENANACSVSSGQQGNVGLTIVGTGATGGGGSSSGCSISCNEGSYACCNY